MTTSRSDPLHHLHPPAVDELRFRLHGGLHEPGDAYYEDTCTLFNTMIERRPRYVAECVVVDDVVTTLAFARDQGLACRGARGRPLGGRVCRWSRTGSSSTCAA